MRLTLWSLGLHLFNGFQKVLPGRQFQPGCAGAVQFVVFLVDNCFHDQLLKEPTFSDSLCVDEKWIVRGFVSQVIEVKQILQKKNDPC